MSNTPAYLQAYIFVEDFGNCLVSKPEWSFGAYGIGDAERIELAEEAFATLKAGGKVER